MSGPSARYATLLTLSMLVLAAVAGYFFRDGLFGDPPLLEPLEVGYAPDLYALPNQAAARKSFREQNLDVRLRQYATGSKVLAGLFAGEVDAAVVGTGPIVQSTFFRTDLRILAAMAIYYDIYRVIGRRDRGIRGVSDLKNRRLGVTAASSMRYFLENFLLENKMSPRDVQLVLVEDIAQLPPLLQRGEIDAFCARDPYISDAATALGEQAILLETTGLPANTLNLVALDTFVAHRPDLLRRFLAGMIHLEKSADPAAPTLSYGHALHYITLDQQLIIHLENHARWILRNLNNGRKQIPNYVYYVEPELLQALSPERVTLIH